MKKSLGLIIAAVIIILAVIFWQVRTQTPPANEEATSTTPVQEQVESSADQTAGENSVADQSDPQPLIPEGLTVAQVAEHNSQTDCYAIVGEKVYNLTSWISQHPGGPDKIISLCGTDATAKFSQQHGSNAQAQATLTNFFIADLVN